MIPITGRTGLSFALVCALMLVGCGKVVTLDDAGGETDAADSIDGSADVVDALPPDARCPDGDRDNDMVCNSVDNCPDTPNEDQTNSDTDTLGDACDNCPTVANQDQLDVRGISAAPIPYAPLAETSGWGTLNFSGGSVELPLPYDWNGTGSFPFFGNDKDRARIHRTGFIGLSTEPEPGWCDDMWSDPERIPCYSKNYYFGNPRRSDLVAFMWSEDFLPDNVQWQIAGGPPERILALSFASDTLLANNPASVQLHLYETSNAIEVHTGVQPSVTPVTIGVEGPRPVGGGSTLPDNIIPAAVLPGENRDFFALTARAVRFHTRLDGPDGVGDVCDNYTITDNGTGCGYGYCS